MARKGGVPPDRVLNAMKLPDFRKWLTERQQKKAKAA
jgi:DNA polymerase (family 10)